LKLAFHTFAFGGRSWLPAWSLEEAIRLTAEMGFEGLELAACRPHGWPADLDAARRRVIRALAADSGLLFSAICPNSVNHNIASPIEEERAATVNYHIECLDLALDLGCHTVVVNGGWSVQPHGRDEAWRWAIEGLAAVAREAERRGAVLALENINSRRADVAMTSRYVALMVDEVASSALKPMIDFYHLHLEGEDPLEAIERFGADLAHIHFLDARRIDRARVAPGWGEAPLSDILAALGQVGYKGWLSVEIWGDDPLALGRQALSFFAEQRQRLI
jgi:sugar phosphate isomerase/epimerase